MDFEVLVNLILDSPTRSVKVTSLPKSLVGKISRVAIILKENQALLYHFPTQLYRFYSKCMETVAILLNK